VDLSAYQGQSIEFQFLVAPACPAGTGCANLADSALLIDGVSGASFTPVPEPSLMLL
jgi:hypothetical protein